MSAQPDRLTAAQARATARRMYEGEWSIPEIREYLAARGQKRCWETIRGWADPEWADRRRIAHREVTRRHRRRRDQSTAFRVIDADAKLDAIRRLDGAGVHARDIAAAVAVFFGDEMSWADVDEALRSGSYPITEAAAA